MEKVHHLDALGGRKPSDLLDEMLELCPTGYETVRSSCSSFSATSSHCNENPIYVFLFWELRGLSPNFHIHVSVSDLYIPRIGPHISFSRLGRSIVGKYCLKRSQAHECRNWECGRAIPFLGIFVSTFRVLVLCNVWQ